MPILNLISVTFWVLIAYQAAIVYGQMRDSGVSRREVTAITILLLAGLNIVRGLISCFVDIPAVYVGQRLLEYFYIGSSVFQILLCEIVLKYIKNKPQQ
jgi:hypothetical protein